MDMIFETYGQTILSVIGAIAVISFGIWFVFGGGPYIVNAIGEKWYVCGDGVNILSGSPGHGLLSEYISNVLNSILPPAV